MDQNDIVVPRKVRSALYILLVIASPKVVARITEDESVAVAELEEFLGKSIQFQADEQYLQEQFDVVLL